MQPITPTTTGTVTAGQTASGIAQSLGQTPAQFLANNPGFAGTGGKNDYQGLTGNIQVGQSYNTGSNATQSTTTLSTANAIDKTGTIKAKQDQLDQSGVTTDPTSGVATYANGAVVQEPEKKEEPKVSGDITPTGGYWGNIKIYPGQPVPKGPDGKPVTLTATSPNDDAFNKTMAEMKAQLDADGARALTNIENTYNQLIKQQEQVNMGATAGITNALLMGGSTGQGSSSQYAPISSAGIIKSQVDYGLRKIQGLNAQKLQAIDDAHKAIRDGNFKIAAQQQERADKIAEEQQKEFNKMQNKLMEANEKADEEKAQIDRDTTISSLYASGLTDVSSIMGGLKEAGMPMSSKQVAETLKNLIPPGLDDLVKTLRTNGAPQDVMQKVLSSGSINAAYQNAGSWAAGGTGIIGEYNLYKAQAESAGQVPVSFNDYQNIDANRKKSIAKAGVASTGGSGTTYSPNQEKIISKVETAVSKSPAYTRTSSMQTYANNVKAALSQSTGVGDIAAINQFQKVIDEGAVTRDQDVTLIQGSQSLANTLKTKLKKLEKGQQLSPELRQQMQKAVDDLYAAQNKAIAKDPFIKSKKNELERNGIDPEDTIFGELESFSETTSNNLIQTEDQAKNKVFEYGKSNPKFQPIITKKLSEVNPYTKQQYTYAELLEIYPEIK